MKNIVIILSIILCSACGLTKSKAETTENTTINTKPAIDTKQILIEYSAISRGYYLDIRIENQSILVKKEQYSPGKAQDLSNAEWDILLDMLDAVDLESLDSLEAPSMKRAHDGAPSASIKITEDSIKYSAPHFDHGNPNTKIKPLVDYILTLSEKVE